MASLRQREEHVRPACLLLTAHDLRRAAQASLRQREEDVRAGLERAGMFEEQMSLARAAAEAAEEPSDLPTHLLPTAHYLPLILC